MPLLVPGETRRITSETDGVVEWVDIHAAASFGTVLAALSGESVSFAALREPTPALIRSLLQTFIIAWSFDEPVTPDNIDRLDLGLAGAVTRQIMEYFWGAGGSEPGKAASEPSETSSAESSETGSPISPSPTESADMNNYSDSPSESLPIT